MALIHPYLLNLQYDPYRMDIFHMLRDQCRAKLTWRDCRDWLKNVEEGIDQIDDGEKLNEKLCKIFAKMREQARSVVAKARADELWREFRTTRGKMLAAIIDPRLLVKENESN